MTNKALFLDRDGTINVDKDYLINIEDFEFEKGVVKSLKEAYDLGYLLIVLTNQSGIARGYFTEADLLKLHTHIQQQAKLAGFEFAEFLYCPHHEQGVVPEFSSRCLCRKPEIGMAKSAIEKYKIDVSRSFMIGDKDADILMGQRVGLKTILVGSGYGKKFYNTKLSYDYYLEDMNGLEEILKENG